MPFGNWNVNNVPVFYCPPRPVDYDLNRAGRICPANWAGRNYSLNTTFAQSWIDSTTYGGLVCVQPQHLVVSTNSNYSLNTTSTHTLPNICSILGRTPVRLPLMRCRRRAYTHRRYVPGCRSCIGAASRSCVWPARSCASGSPWELHMGAAPAAAVKFCGSCVQPLPSRCQRMGAAMELRRSWVEDARTYNRCRNLTFQVKFRCLRWKFDTMCQIFTHFSLEIWHIMSNFKAAAAVILSKFSLVKIWKILKIRL